MVTRASVQDGNLVHVDAHVTQLMLKSCPGHEREQSLGQALTPAGGFVFVTLFFFIFFFQLILAHLLDPVSSSCLSSLISYLLLLLLLLPSR